MRKLLLLAVAFLLLAAPAWAVDDSIDIEVTIDSILTFTINPAGPLTLTLSSVWASSDWHDLSSDIDVDVACNEAWDLDLQITDGDNDWGGLWDVRLDDGTWVQDETDGSQSLFDEHAAGTFDETWNVEVQIPWPTGPGTYDCTLAFTCSVD